MNKTLLTCLLLLVAGFSSCKKCAECVTTITQTSSVPMTGYPVSSTTRTGELCGDDLKEMEQQNYTTTAQVGNVTVTSTTKTTCN